MTKTYGELYPGDVFQWFNNKAMRLGPIPDDKKKRAVILTGDFAGTVIAPVDQDQEVAFLYSLRAVNMLA